MLAKAAGAPVALECRRSRVRLVAVQRARRTSEVHSSAKCTPPAIRRKVTRKDDFVRILFRRFAKAMKDFITVYIAVAPLPFGAQASKQLISRYNTST